MRARLLVLAFVAVLPATSAVAADGCGVGCHSTISGACVVDGWGTGAHVWNACPVTSRARPPCGPGYVWHRAKRACLQSSKDWL